MLTEFDRFSQYDERFMEHEDLLLKEYSLLAVEFSQSPLEPCFFQNVILVPV